SRSRSTSSSSVSASAPSSARPRCATKSVSASGRISTSCATPTTLDATSRLRSMRRTDGHACCYSAEMANELARETSPYLLQHADNPVDWLPWSRAALEKARAENKPILLSIGYSACHWCHVMAHESFEDEETAELMNRLYVNVKVDREERPDLDKIYQTAHQLFTGRAGGWPLTVFLTPDTHVPVVVGTYFPKEPRYGMPSFKYVLTQVEAYYRTYPDEIRTRGSTLLETFGRMESAGSDASPARAPLDLARDRLVASFDREHGGFGGAPKFPRPNALELLLE